MDVGRIEGREIVELRSLSVLRWMFTWRFFFSRLFMSLQTRTSR